MQEFIDAFIDPANIAGHISYMLLIGSMLMRRMLYLRIMAISAGSFSAAYYLSIGDPISLFWEVLFTTVNLAQLVILYVENKRGSFTREEQAFIDEVLTGVERAQARRLLKLGAWTEVSEDMVLIREDTVPSHLYYVVKGHARVERKGRTIGGVGPKDFLGEMSYLSGGNATATVTTSEHMRYLAFDREQLRQHLARNPDVRSALESSFNRNLVDKLVKTSTVPSVPAPMPVVRPEKERTEKAGPEQEPAPRAEKAAAE